MEMVSWTGRRVPSQRQVAVLGMDTELRLEGILLDPRTKRLCASACGVISQTTIRALPGKSSDDRLTDPSRANRGAHTASSQVHRRDSWEEVGVKENDALQNHCTCCAGARNAWRDPSDEQAPPKIYSAEPITTPTVVNYKRIEIFEVHKDKRACDQVRPAKRSTIRARAFLGATARFLHAVHFSLGV